MTARSVLQQADIARALTRISHEILESNRCRYSRTTADRIWFTSMSRRPISCRIGRSSVTPLRRPRRRHDDDRHQEHGAAEASSQNAQTADDPLVQKMVSGQPY